MRKYVTQVFEDINSNPKLMEQYVKDPMYSVAVKTICEYAFDPAKKWILPEGEPPYKTAAEPMGMTPTNLVGELRRLYVFTRADLKPVKREQLFISLLEGVHPDEAKLLCAVKDQTLHKLYPKITRKLVTDAGIIPPVEKKAKESATS
jgi:hypothetical protein